MLWSIPQLSCNSEPAMRLESQLNWNRPPLTLLAGPAPDLVHFITSVTSFATCRVWTLSTCALREIENNCRSKSIDIVNTVRAWFLCESVCSKDGATVDLQHHQTFCSHLHCKFFGLQSYWKFLRQRAYWIRWNIRLPKHFTWMFVDFMWRVIFKLN